MSEAGPAISRFAFPSGPLGGTHLTLYPTCLVHRSDAHLETMPLAGMTAVRVAFERDSRKLGWAIGLVLTGLVLLAIAGPLGAFAGGAANEMANAGSQGVPRTLYGFFRVVEAIASGLPVLALVCVLAGSGLGALWWRGTTTLVVSLPGSERVYPAGGRNTMLLDFAEALSERLMLMQR